MDSNNYKAFSFLKVNLYPINSSAFLNFLKFFIFLIISTESIVNAQEKNLQKQPSTNLEYEEIPVTVFIDNVGSFDLNILYISDQLVYIPIEDLFRTLQIACKPDVNKTILEGFIDKETNLYKIDYVKKQIQLGDKKINTQQELIYELGTLYLKSSIFKEIFGIDLSFNFKSLSIKLVSNFELPIVKQTRIEKMQRNISTAKGEVIADTIINRSYHLFKFGSLDWNFASYQNWKGTNNNIVGLGIGTELLYGEAYVSANYNDQYKFNNRQLNYLWRWIDNDKKYIKQAQIGKIAVQSIPSINAPLIGVTIRNSPTTIRKATGKYIISEITEPNWNVELYLNNVLIDFTKADAAGNFIFKVPNVYGFTNIKLKYYGPMGEERIEERVTNVPYTVMPVNEFEYGVTTGVLQDSTHGKYGKGEFYYGLSRKITVGGGLEYLSSITEGKLIPFAKATLQPFSKLTLNLEYAHGVRSRGILNYYFSRDILLEIDYANYVSGQRATIFNASEELKTKLSIPFKYHRLNGYLKLDYSQLKYTSFDFNYANLLASINYKQLNINTSTQLNWIDNNQPYMINDFSLSYRLKKNIIIRPSIKYNVSDASLISYKTEIEKSSYLGFYAVSYEKNKLANNDFINLSFKYDLSFARVSTVVTISNGNFITSESAQGSIAFDNQTNYIYTNKNSSYGKGGLLLFPFLDINQNGIFDKGEKLVKLNNVKISGGKVIYSKKDSIIRIPDLNVFTNYTLTFSDTDLDNIAWRFKNKIYKVLVDPNQFKRIDIPINIVSEMSGMVYKKEQNILKEIARISVKIYQQNNDKLVTEILSESDGYLYFLGLKPGDYRACIDEEQLNRLNLTANPTCQYFTIKSMLEGDIVDGMNFVLTNKNQETQIKEIQKIEKSTINKKSNSDQSFNKDEAKILYVLQLMASKSAVNINDYFSKLIDKIPTIQINETHQKGGWYSYNSGIYNTRTAANNMALKVKDAGWKDYFVKPIKSVDSIDVIPTEILREKSLEIKPITTDSQVEKPTITLQTENNKLPTINSESAQDIKILYRLQIMASRRSVNINKYFSKLLIKMPLLQIEETFQKDGWYRYQIVIYNTPKEAMAIVQQIKSSGWKDLFIDPYLSIK